MNVTEAGFGAMAAKLMALAEKHAGGKIAFLLEGGYDLAALKGSVVAVLREMEEQGSRGAGEKESTGAEWIEPVVRRVREVQERYWG